MRIFRNKLTKQKVELNDNQINLIVKLEKDKDYQELMII